MVGLIKYENNFAAAKSSITIVFQYRNPAGINFP